MPVRRWYLSLAAIAAAALLLRLAHLAEIVDTPMVAVLLGDARVYDGWARQIASGEWLGTQVFYQAPLYPYVLGVFYSVAGPTAVGARALQAVFGSAACVLLAVAGRQFFNGTRRRGGRRHAGLLPRGHLLRLGPSEVLARPAADDAAAGAGRRVPRRPARPLAGCRRRDPRALHAEPREHAGALSGRRRVAAARVRGRPLAAAPAVARGVHVRRRRRAGPRRGAQLLRRRRTAGLHLAGGAQFLYRQSRGRPRQLRIASAGPWRPRVRA